MTKNTQMVCYDKAKHVGLGRPTDVARTPFFYLKKKLTFSFFIWKNILLSVGIEPTTSNTYLLTYNHLNYETNYELVN